MEEKKEKRCMYCKKVLLEEKLPLCLRCRLAGRNKTCQGATIAAGAVFTFFQVKNAIDSNNNNPTDIV